MASKPRKAVSEQLYARAVELMPGGVSSPVRAFKKVGGTPIYLTRGSGAQVFDEDGNAYTDFCLGWGSLILGHAHPAVVAAVTKAVCDGLTFGACHRHEVELAERILEGFSPLERVRFTVSGTEAVQTALRLARAKTRRGKILKFSGCYHGHMDALLVRAGSGLITQGLADSEGVSTAAAAETLVAQLGNLEALEKVFREEGTAIAAAIVEPVPANNGLLPQAKLWLQRLRELTGEHGALLIFDEVITGFRNGFQGHGRTVGVTPDLVTLGKIIGGGLPVGAVVGPRQTMDLLAPSGGVYHAGTMAGNPVALSAGIATLNELRKGAVYRHLDELSQTLAQCLTERDVTDNTLRVQRVGSMFWPYLHAQNSQLPQHAEAIDAGAVSAYRERYGSWLEQGVYLPPSAYEVGFMSAAHTKADMSRLVDVLSKR